MKRAFPSQIAKAVQTLGFGLWQPNCHIGRKMWEPEEKD